MLVLANLSEWGLTPHWEKVEREWRHCWMDITLDSENKINVDVKQKDKPNHSIERFYANMCTILSTKWEVSVECHFFLTEKRTSIAEEKLLITKDLGSSEKIVSTLLCWMPTCLIFLPSHTLHCINVYLPALPCKIVNAGQNVKTIIQCVDTAACLHLC